MFQSDHTANESPVTYSIRLGSDLLRETNLAPFLNVKNRSAPVSYTHLTLPTKA